MLRRSKTDGATGGPRLLVVNEDEAGCELVSRVLESHGAEVTRIHSHTEAVQLLNRGGDVDGVLIDFTSGGASANLKLLDSIRHASEGKRDIPVVILATSASNRLFAYQQGADSFIVRPVHANDLAAEAFSVAQRSPEERQAARAAALKAAQSA